MKQSAVVHWKHSHVWPFIIRKGRTAALLQECKGTLHPMHTFHKEVDNIASSLVRSKYLWLKHDLRETNGFIQIFCDYSQWPIFRTLLGTQQHPENRTVRKNDCMWKTHNFAAIFLIRRVNDEVPQWSRWVSCTCVPRWNRYSRTAPIFWTLRSLHWDKPKLLFTVTVPAVDDDQYAVLKACVQPTHSVPEQNCILPKITVVLTCSRMLTATPTINNAYKQCICARGP